MIRHLKNTILATAFLAVSGAHAAPILEVSSDGKLTGASGVAQAATIVQTNAAARARRRKRRLCRRME